MRDVTSPRSYVWVNRIVGIVGRFLIGTILGLIPGIIVGEWAVDHLVQRIENEPAVAYEQRFNRVRTPICLGFELAFGVAFAIGDRVRLPHSLRGVTVGVLGGVGVAVAGALLVALIRNEFPFNQNKVASEQSLEWARSIGVPLFGVIGGLAGHVRHRKSSRERRG